MTLRVSPLREGSVIGRDQGPVEASAAVTNVGVKGYPTGTNFGLTTPGSLLAQVPPRLTRGHRAGMTDH